MRGAPRLIWNVLTLRAPPRALAWAVLNRLNWWLKTGNRRYEFDRLYEASPDPYAYLTNPEELAKYRRTLDVITEQHPAATSLLEIGCSIGVFTDLAAERFEKVMAVDVSGEALRLAAARNERHGNIRYHRDHAQSLDLGERFDVITCAEVLTFVPQRDAGALCNVLRSHLAPDGVIVFVAPAGAKSGGFYGFNDWEQVLSGPFRKSHDEKHRDLERPYEVLVFRRRLDATLEPLEAARA